MKNKIVLKFAILVSVFVANQAFGWTIANRTSGRVNIKATYWGELFCSPDDFYVEPGETRNISAGACAIRSLTSGNGAGGLTSASGTKFHIAQDGSGFWIRQGE